MNAMTPGEWIRYLRREHARTEHPVACCRKDHQNWPCDTIRGLDAAVAAERDRIRTHATEHAFRLYRPGNGPGAGQQAMDAVPLTSLLEVL
jgi:hypothetical protein